MEYAKVFRVENHLGEGPYRYTGPIIRKLGRMADVHCSLISNHPLPQQEGLIGREPNKKYERCGFKSLEQLKQWFTDDEITMMGIHGFDIVIKKGIITARSKRQILFVPDELVDNGTTEEILWEEKWIERL